MKPLLLKSLFSFFLAIASITSFGQETKKPDIEIGSQVLTQTGNDKYCYKNAVYSYEKVMDIPSTDKKELYNRVKKWIIANLKTSKDNIFFDDDNANSITATTALKIKDMDILTNQGVEFKLVISFKDNKIKVEAYEFLFYGLNGHTPMQMPLNDLRPYPKKLMQAIYDDFDDKFVAMRKSMKAAAANASGAKDW